MTVTVIGWRPALARSVVLRHDRVRQAVWVVPDYFDGVPKPCMGGWGAVSLTVAPDGAVLPCPASRDMLGPDVPNVRDRSLEWIWNSSPAFDRYRGTEWMSGPCDGCPRREIDFGGCRCQAHALTGDAARTDPACALSPDHALVRTLSQTPRADAPSADASRYVYRGPDRHHTEVTRGAKR